MSVNVRSAATAPTAFGRSLRHHLTAWATGSIAVGVMPSAAFAFGPEATPVDAVLDVVGVLSFGGGALAVVVAGFWLGLQRMEAGRAAPWPIPVALLAGALAGLIAGAPHWLGLAVAVATAIAAALLFVRRNLPGMVRAWLPSLPAAAVGLCAGVLLGQPGAAAAYLAGVLAAFAVATLVLLALPAALVEPIHRRGGERAIGGMGAWFGVLAVLVAAIGLAPREAAFGKTTTDLAVTRADLSDEEIPVVVQGLLERVYVAFEKRDEAEIYDALSAVTEGEVLSELYLQRRSAMVMEDSGGGDSQLVEVELVRADADPRLGRTGYAIRGAWRVLGSVGHWGHAHDRLNRYEADLTIAPVDGVWKIDGFTLRDVVRTSEQPL